MADMKKEESSHIISEGKENVLRINATAWSMSTSIEDNAFAMGYVIDQLAASPGVSRIVFHQRKRFTYDYDQTQLLVGIAQLYHHLVKDKRVFSVLNLGYTDDAASFIGQKVNTLQHLLSTLLRTDPLGCYVEVKRLLREEKILLQQEKNQTYSTIRQHYVGVLMYVFHLLDKTKLIALTRDQLDGYSVGDRTIYKNIFRAAITPDFIYTRLLSEPPLEGEQIDLYSVDETDIIIYKLPGDIKILYHITPPEFKLTDDEQYLVELARNVLAEHRPREEDFLDPQRMRTTFLNIGRDLLQELSENKGFSLDYRRIEVLAAILVRYTVGFGLLEILLQDQKIQDIVVNSPVGSSPIYVVHQEYGECTTNIYPSKDDGDGWATKLRLLSGRPLDEANPVLDTELLIPGARSRVAVITNPLSPEGIGYALRRHRDDPWTLPLFMTNKMISPLGAGLLSFLIDGARTLLVAGTRSSGKTSLLGSLMVEIMRKYRIVTIEDTQELPVSSLRTLGYNIQPMKVRSALTSSGIELGADEGIRTSLRLGDSSLIVGEVRSVEARALYEAMRIGALANVVAGTIHGADPYGVYDRVVNDLGVPKTSFKATDILVIANPIVSADGLKRWKRVLQITEVRKHWKDDPSAEGGFVDLLRYDPQRDLLDVTDELKNGDSDVLKSIAGNVREWVGNWDAVWENVLLRARMKELLVDTAQQIHLPRLLEASFVISANDQFHLLSEMTLQEVGALDTKRIFTDWKEWLKREVKHLQLAAAS